MTGSPASLPLPASAVEQILHRGGDPSDLLSWLTCGDPLHLENRCAMRMRSTAFLVDCERLFDRATVRIALVAHTFDPKHDLGAWLDGRIDESAQDLMRADAEYVADRKEVDLSDPRLDSYQFLLALPPNQVLPALVAFNQCPFDERKAFFALLIEDIPVQECLDAGMGPPELLRERCLNALGAVLLDPLKKEGML